MIGLVRRRFLATGLALAVAGCDNRGEQTSGNSARKAPELVATTADGRVVRLEDLRGKVVLVTFWRPGCGPCLVELPQIDAFYRAHRRHGFAVAAIGVDASQADSVAAARKMALSFPLLIDPLGLTKDKYGVEETPTSVIVDAQGHVADRVVGVLEPTRLAEKVVPLL